MTKIEELEAEVKRLRETNPLYIRTKKLAEAKLALEVLQNKEKAREVEAEALRNSEEYKKVNANYGRLKNGFRTREMIDAEDEWYKMQSKIKQLEKKNRGGESNLRKEIIRLEQEITNMKDGA